MLQCTLTLSQSWSGASWRTSRDSSLTPAPCRPSPRQASDAHECIPPSCLSSIPPGTLQVYDQHLDFVSLEPRLFTLNQSGSYAAYNGSNQSEEAINDSMRTVTHGIYSALATFGTLPIIRAPANGASEMVARQLNDLVAAAWSGGGAFVESVSSVSSRPLVVILDRALDFATVLQHT